MDLFGGIINADDSAIKNEIDNLVELLNKYNYEYYVLAQSSISDFEFDKKIKYLEELESKYPNYINPNSPTQKVGGYISKSFSQIEHRYPMLSLGNTYSKEDLIDFDNRIKKVYPTESIEYICELKFDGISISLTYENGILKTAATRGNGKIGDDVTENAKTINRIPHKLKAGDYPNLFEIRGEVFMHRKTFEKINQEKVDQGEQTYANPRNFAAGTMKLLNHSETAKRPLDCFLYYINSDEKISNNHWDALEKAKEWGFPVSEHSRKCNGIDAVWDFIIDYQEKRRNLSFDIDGIVIKVNDYQQQNNLGYTAKIPRWAISFKYQAEQAETELVSVDFQVGRTGAITPVANLKPVSLAGTIVKRATLHNENEIDRLSLCHKDTVIIEKGGEIIPKIIEVIFEKRKTNDKILFPSNCPECNTALIRSEGEAIWYCNNYNHCKPQQIGKIQHFSSRKAMDISGLGDEKIVQLFDAGLLNNISDIYTLPLKKDQLLSLERMGEKTVLNLFESIEKSKNNTFDKILFGLGIRYVGATIATKLAEYFGNIDQLLSTNYDELISIDEIGDSIAKSIIDFISLDENINLITDLKKSGLFINSYKVELEKQSDVLEGKTFVISGVFSTISRDDLKKYIESHGGKVVSSISSKLSYLIAGENMGPSKLKKAEQLNIKIISEQDFFAEIQNK